jgi:hypothetical protein
MNTFLVEGRGIAAAWISAVQKLDQMPDRRAFHTVVRIADPLRDDPDTHTGLDRALERLGLQPVETVANTIFPADLAARSRDHAHLANRYRAMYDTVRKLSPKNKWGTYFGRLIAYPSSGYEHGFDQLAAVISWLRLESSYKGGKTARYETMLAHPLDTVGDGPGPPAAATCSVAVQQPGTDTGAMATPCLSHLSFQLDRAGAVHALATYRSHYMTERAYGNYLGLGRLLGYVSAEGGLRPGTLTVVAGYAQIEPGTITRIRPLLTEGVPLFALGETSVRT